MRKERKEVSLSLLKTPAKNTRIHPPKQIAEIRRSLKKWGQIKNAVIDDQNLVLAGNGLVEAMRQEGFKKINVIVMYDLTENDKKKLMMADNKTAGLGMDDLNNIEEIIAELDGDFDIPGYDDEVLKSLSAASEEISAALEDYGKATERNLAGIDASANLNGGGDDEEGGGEPLAAAGVEGPKGRESVVCPKCGEEIWL